MRLPLLLLCSALGGLAACSSSSRPPGSSDAPGGSGGAGGYDASVDAADAAGGHADGGDASDGSDASDAVDDAVLVKDGAVPVPDVIDEPPPGCALDEVALASGRLVSTGATPAAFAAAYDAAVTTPPSAGPLLAVFDGLTALGDPSLHLVRVGPRGTTEAGAGDDFLDTPATIAFDLPAPRHVIIPYTEAGFALAVPVGGSVRMLPVVAIELDGTFDDECGVLTVGHLRMLVPSSASAIAFGAQTVGQLMGTTTATYAGGTQTAWPLELTGVATEVMFAPGPPKGVGGQP